MHDLFQVLNFDPVKEILKIRCHVYILMKKVIILRKIHVKMKSFAPPQKENTHIHASAADLLHTVLEQEISIDANTRSSHRRCSAKKVFFKARDIDCICCRELDSMLIISTKIPQRERSISPSNFYGHVPNYQPLVLVLFT